MGRKAIVGIEGIKKAALAVFMEKGYDGASMRDIAARAGCSVGLAYNYFHTKDEVFAGAMESFFAHYEAHFEQIVSGGLRNPFQTMTAFFSYMEEETAKFREEFADKLHWMVRWAIRERTLVIIEPYIRRIVEMLADWGARPPLESSVTAALLAHGVGGIILHEEKEIYYGERAGVLRGVNLLMGLEPEQAELMFPRFAAADDEDGCVELLQMVSLCKVPAEEDFRRGFAAALREREILVIRHHGGIAAMLCFSRRCVEIKALALRPAYLGQGLEMRLLITALAQFAVGAEAAVYIGAEQAAFWRGLGFTDGGPCIRDKSPCLRLSLAVPATAKEIAVKAGA